MKNLKHLIALVMALALMLCLCACTGGDDSTSEPSGSTAATDSSESTGSSESIETSLPDPVVDPVEPTYTVTVVDQDGNPMAGVMVQLCLDQCSPAVTNGEGVAEFYLDEADYHVSILQMPDGYDYATEETEFYFADGSNELTITLQAADVEEPVE